MVITTRSGYPDFEQFVHVQAMVNNDPRAQLATTMCPYSVCVARNKAVADMLGQKFHDGKPYTHIMFVDSDVLVQQDALTLLLDLDVPVATGCYPAIRTHFGLEVPYITVVKEINNKEVKWWHTWFDGVKDTPSCGAGCLLIKRDVFEAIGFPWFRWQEQYVDGKYRADFGEDSDFCSRVYMAGMGPIKAHGAVRCGHYKKLDIASQLVEEGCTPHDIKWSGPKSIEQKTAPPPYGSHMNALKAIGRSFKIGSVLEFGAGIYSTPIFLNRDYYPNLEQIVSLENDLSWIDKLKNQIKDNRLRLQYCHLETMAEVVGQVSDADLYFVDCALCKDLESYEFELRVKIIEKLIHKNGIIVTHDSDFDKYKERLDRMPFKYKAEHHCKTGPDTLVLSNDIDVANIKWEI